MLSAECITHARKIFSASSRCVAPVAQAQILPAEAYVSEAFWEFEKQAIFSREWMCVGHVKEVPDPGDYLPLDVLDEPILLVRDMEGVLRVLSAVCQHRGHPLARGVAAPEPNRPCLHGDKLVCPYHHWTYALDGRLLAAPRMQDTIPVSELRQSIRLPELRMEVFHGLVFVNLDRDAPPLGPTLRKLSEELQSYELASLVPMPSVTDKNLPWNWKLHHENAIEPYHTDFLHKGLHDPVPTRLTKFCDFELGDGHVMRTTGMLDPEADHWEDDGRRRLPAIPTLTEEQTKRVLFVSIMPGMVGVFQPNSVSITCINPTSAGTITSRRINLYPQLATTMENFESVRADRFAHLKGIIEQDKLTLTALQMAYHSRFAPRGRLSVWEQPIPQLNSWLMERYGRALGERDAIAV